MNADKTEVKNQPSNMQQTSTQEDIRIYVENKEIKTDAEHDALQIFTTDGIEVSNKNLHPGIYLVKITRGSTIYVKKTIISNRNNI